MNRIITVHPTDKTKKIVHRRDDMTCQVEVKHEGLFEGVIETISSSGRYEIRLTKLIEVKR